MALTGEFAFIEDALDELQEFVEFVAEAIPNLIADAIEDALRLPDGTGLPDVVGDIWDELNDVTEITLSLERLVMNAAAEAERDTERLLADLLEDARRSANTVLQSDAVFFQTLEDKIQSSQIAVLDETEGFFGSLKNKIVEQFDEASDFAEALFSGELGKATAMITDELDIIGQQASVAFAKAEATTRDLATVFEDEIGKLPSGIAGELIGGLLGPLGGIIDFLNLFNNDKWSDAFSIVDNIWKPLEDDPFVGPIIKTLAPDGVIGLGIIGVVAIMPFIASIVSMATTGVFAAPMELARQSSFARDRPTKMTMGEIRELVWRQQLSLSDAREHWHALGYEERWFDKLLGLGEAFFQPSEILTLWRRNLITDFEAETMLAQIGFRGEKGEQLKELAFALPPVQDLVLFAVREVFQLERAAELGQLEGLPPDILQAYQDKFGGFGSDVEGSIRAFSEFTKQAGVAPEWAAAYWAAHWRLPGVQSLFTMVHRLAPDILELQRKGFEAAGINVDDLAFDMEELQKVLKAQDFSPFFREKLTAIAFHPLTRVDVRRIHALGLIDDEELIMRYRELGFSPDNAELMGEFTKAYNFREDEPDEQETRELTRTQILKFFENGALTFEAAQEQLETIGYSTEAALTFVSLKAAAVLDDEIGLRLDVIRTRFKTEDIDFGEAGNLIDELGLPPLQKDKELARLELERDRQEFHPSMGDLTKFVSEGILSVNEYENALENIGVPKRWRDRYVVLNTEEAPQTRDIRSTAISSEEIDILWDADALTWQRFLDLIFSIGFNQASLESALRAKQGGNITTPQGNYIRRKFA